MSYAEPLSPDDYTTETIESVVANAIGYEMLRHDGRPVQKVHDVDSIDVSDEETGRCRDAAQRVLNDLREIGQLVGGD